MNRALLPTWQLPQQPDMDTPEEVAAPRGPQENSHAFDNFKADVVNGMRNFRVCGFLKVELAGTLRYCW